MFTKNIKLIDGLKLSRQIFVFVFDLYSSLYIIGDYLCHIGEQFLIRPKLFSDFRKLLDDKSMESFEFVSSKIMILPFPSNQESISFYQ